MLDIPDRLRFSLNLVFISSWGSVYIVELWGPLLFEGIFLDPHEGNRCLRVRG